uniref:C1q domain-containing protein n=1 Tax=Oncorhynchus kisutch TaxID=8019 RepID=A0A8C7JE56_ONCKI
MFDRLHLLTPVLLFLPLVIPVPPQGNASPAPCRRCCDDLEPQEVRTFINMTILKGDKGNSGDRGTPGKSGEEGAPGSRGPMGPKGTKGQASPPGDSFKNQDAAFSVGRRKSLHSVDYYQALVFDTEFVNLHGHFDMFKGKFYCYVPGIYFFNINIHTWNFKETYLHIMRNDKEQAISLMLPLELSDEVWVRLYKRERENTVYSDDVDVYITFNGYLIKPTLE